MEFSPARQIGFLQVITLSKPKNLGLKPTLAVDKCLLSRLGGCCEDLANSSYLIFITCPEPV
jgi:hypothetical protein